MPRERFVTGFGDPAFRFSMNFIGAPALTAAEFKDYRQDFILGASLRVIVPLGQYDDDETREHRQQSLVAETRDRLARKRSDHGHVEVAPAVTFYTDNGDFFGGQTRARGANLLRAGEPAATPSHPAAGWR